MQNTAPQRFLIPTKLHAPFIAADTVHRERIHSLLKVKDHERMLWISAPGGSGKTTALGDYLSTQQTPIAWVSLDESDNEVAVFFAYVLKACQSFFDTDDLLLPLLSGHSAQRNYLIFELITRFANYAKPALLVLDDWHLITNEAIQTALQSLLEHQPTNLKLIILSRHHCPWAARQQAIVRHWLRELTAQDLAFTNGETQQLFSENAPKAQLNQLVKQLDGWAAGLKMVALNNAGLSVSNAHLLHGQFNFNDYFKAEVFDGLPSDLQSSLLRCSVLKRFDRALLQALNPNLDTDNFITQCLKRQLFTIQLDNENQWFRFHHLFSDFLKGLSSRQSGLHKQCYQAAAQHCLSVGLDEEALTYALHSQNRPLLEEVILKAGKRMELAGYHRLLIQAYESFSERDLMTRFELALFYAWFRFKVQSHPPLDVVCFIEQAYLALTRPTTTQTQQYCIIRCNLAFELEHIIEADQFFQQIKITTVDEITALHSALPYNEKQDLVYKLSLAAELACNKGNLAQAIRYHEMEQQLAAKLGTRPSTWNIHQLAAIYHSQGQSERAQQWFEYGLDLSEKTGSHYNVSAWCMNISMAEIQLDYLYHDQVSHYCQQANKRAIFCQNDDWRMVPTSVHIRSLLLANQPVTELVNTLQTLMRNRRFHSHSKAQGDAALIQVWKSTHNTASLTAWLAAESPISFAEAVNRLPDYLYRLNVYRVYWYLAKLDDRDLPRTLLSQLQRDVIHSAEGSFHFVSAQLQMVLSGWLFCRGKTNAALTQINQAFSAFHRFKSIGTALEDFALFNELINVDAYNDNALLEFSPSAKQFVERLRSLIKQEINQALPEVVRAIPLTAKEWQVLQSIGDNKTNQQIANQMFISEGTVKSHINRIYRKLGISNRQQAVEVLLGIEKG